MSSRRGFQILVASRRVAPWRFRSRSCRASTLIELVICMSIGSAVMSLAVGVVHQAMTFHALGSERAHRDRSLVRMTRQFRTDVRQAVRYQLDPSGNLQLTQFDGRSIHYATAPNQVVRTLVGADQQTWVERYPLGDRCTATVSIGAAEPETIGLTVETDVGSMGGAARVDRQVIAVPGATVRGFAR